MKCQYCGNEATKGQKFCICCGTRLEQEPEQQEAAIARQPEPEDFSWTEEPELRIPEPEEWAVKAGSAPLAVTRPVYREDPAPALKLPINRGLGKMFFLGLLTLGIYPTVIWSRIVTELNIAASRYDGRRTVSYFGVCMLAPITLGIFVWVWMHNFCCRIGNELKRREIDYSFSAGTFWLWGVLGSLILVGPFVFTHKLMKAMNRINADYNVKG